MKIVDSGEVLLIRTPNKVQEFDVDFGLCSLPCFTKMSIKLTISETYLGAAQFLKADKMGYRKNVNSFEDNMTKS